MSKNQIGSRCIKLLLWTTAVIATLLSAGPTQAQAQPAAGISSQTQLSVVATPAVLPAVDELVPSYLAKQHVAVKLESGGSVGTSGTAIPARLDRGEVFDVIILYNGSLDDLIRGGKVLPGSKVDLVLSDIGLATKAGTPKPDIHNADALKAALLAAKSIAYTPGVSGVYVRDVMFPKLGIADQMKIKTVIVQGSGEAVADGKAEIGFQQVSELMPIKGLDIQPLPRDAAEPSIFSAAIQANAPHPQEAREFIQWLASPAAYDAIRRSGLKPFNSK